MSPEVVKFQKLPPQDLPVDSQPPRTFAEMVKGAKGDLPSTYHEPTSLQPFATGSTEEPPKVPENTDEPMDEKVEVPKNDDLFFASTKTTRQQQMMAKNDLPEKVDEEEVPTPSKAKGNKRKPKAKAKASAKAKAKASAKAKAKASAKAKAKASAKGQSESFGKGQSEGIGQKGWGDTWGSFKWFLLQRPKQRPRAGQQSARLQVVQTKQKLRTRSQLRNLPLRDLMKFLLKDLLRMLRNLLGSLARRRLPGVWGQSVLCQRLVSMQSGSPSTRTWGEHLQYPTSFEVRWSQSI